MIPRLAVLQPPTPLGGEVFILVTREDLAPLAGLRGEVPVFVERAGDGLEFWLPGRMRASFSVPAEAEVCLRHARRIRVAVASAAGLTPLGFWLQAEFPQFAIARQPQGSGSGV